MFLFERTNCDSLSIKKWITLFVKGVFSARLPDEVTTRSAEAKAIEFAIQHIMMSNIHFLQYFQMHFHVNNLFKVWIWIIHTSWLDCKVIIIVSNQGIIVNFSWIPNYIGILENNMKRIRLQNPHVSSKLKLLLQTLTFYQTLYELSLADILGLLRYK